MFSFIEYIIHNHIESAIAFFIAVICLVGGYVVYSSAFRRDENQQHDVDLSKIEESIERLLENHKPGAVTAGEAGGGATAVPATILKELEEKKAEIEKLKSESGGSESAPELLSKIKSLEDRLSEYEIIEDDIADLSKFKEENARLKRQLETLSSSAGAPAAKAPTDEVFTLENSEEDLEENSKKASEPAAEEEPKATPEIPPEEQAKVDSALEALGAETVDEIDSDEVDLDETEPDELAAIAESVEKENEEPEVTSEDLDEDLTEEPMEASADQDSEPEESANVLEELTEGEDVNEEDPLVALGDIDTDKMLSEIQSLSEGADASVDVVKKNADLNKMAAEVKKSGG